MKKRLLSAFMALALCLTLLPAPAWAAEADAPEGRAAQIGETVYPTLPDAVNAAKDGDTIKLLTDYKTAEGADEEEDGGLTITKSVTLDLNSHGMDYFRVVQVNDAAETLPSGNLTVEDTSEAQTGKVTGMIKLLAGKLTINGGTIGDDRNGVEIEKGTLTVNGGTIGFLYGDAGSGTVTINGGAVKNARFGEGFNITVTGGSGHTGLWNVMEGTWNISGGEFEDVVFQTESPAENLHITGGMFGAIARQIQRNSIKEPAPISGLLADGYAFYQKTDSEEYDQCVKLTDAITSLENVQVKGHTHSFVNGVCTVCDYACLHTNMNGDGFCPDCNTQMVAKVEVGDTVTYSADFKEAMKNATNGTTVTLLADIEWGVTPQDRATITGDGKIVTLNLNGHMITGGWLDVGNDNVARIVRNYDGTTNLSAEDLIKLGCFSENLENRNSKNPSLGADQSSITIRLGAEDFEVSNVKLGSAEAGDTTASFTIKLKPRPGQTAANFVFEDGTSEMTVKEVPVSTREAFLSSSPKAGKLNVANDHAGVYTLDLSKLLPKLDSPMEYGKVTYALDTVSINGGYYDATKGNAEVKDGKLILPIQAVKTSTESNIGTVKVKVTSGNIVDFPLLINVDATNKIVPTGEPTLSTETLTYGQALSAIKLSGKLHDNVNDKDIEGTFTWANDTVKPGAGSNEAMWKFTPTDGATYAETTGTVSITVNKAKPTGEPIYTKITAAKKTLADANLKPNASWPTGTIQWVDKDGKELPDTTEVKANTAYKWIFTPDAEFTANYTTATGELTLYSVSTGGSSSSGSTVKTDTVTNPDGSVTKTETKSDGTVVETTTGKDGSTTKTETKKDGSSVTESKDAAGSTGTVKTDKNGQTTAETTLSGKAVEDAKKNGEPVTAPVEVEATRNSDTAPTVKIELPRNSGDTKVEIPVTNVKPGTVAVLVHADGTEEIVKNSLPTADGIQLTVNGGATVKIVDNSKDFIDTRNHWAKDAIDFVSARGLVNGMSATTYAPDASTTRAQLWTILARQSGADLTGGATWYEKAQAWSKANGVSDGSDPNAAISRAQVVTMLWRAAGSPAAQSGTAFQDVAAGSYYGDAVDWAVAHGITAGVGGGRFDPNSTCTRGQIATFLYRLYLSR